MFTEDDLLPLSALQHFLFCERQCGLIHIEQVWVENLFTAQGRIMHERVDQTGSEKRGRVRFAYGVMIRSLSLGVSGKADLVEFHLQDDGLWLPHPVEYKRGRPKKENWDRVQLCAQAICLEEMLAVEIRKGALFYGKQRRRQVVEFDRELREETRQTAIRLHELISSGRTPPANYSKRCESCSLLSVCLPRVTDRKRSVAEYLQEAVS